MDLMSGTGPDIIITGGANEQLSRGEYFLDLSDYIKSNSSINEETYFVNAFEAMKYNGALYQLPIGFYVDGFISSSENFGGRNGMTFDEYMAMVKDVCNGNDPLFDHQLSYSRTEVAAGCGFSGRNCEIRKCVFLRIPLNRRKVCFSGLRSCRIGLRSEQRS